MPSFPLPDEFLTRTGALLGPAEAALLFESLEGEPEVSVRWNPYKISGPPGGEAVPWCRYGRYLEERPSFTLDPLFHAGTYYVQEASSMFLEHIYRSVFDEGDAPRVLDLCAAPGGKTTLLSTLVGPEGLVAANEVIRSRAAILSENVRKWGLGNVVVSSQDPAQWGDYEHFFDLAVVDAPCSGEGMFRKNPEARGEWSPENVRLCAARDRRILGDVWSALRPGGVLVFSTCTFNEEENEGTVRWLSEEYGAEGVDIPCDPAWGVACGAVDGIRTFRFYPHKLRGEGFFAAVLRKGDGRRHERAPKARKMIFSELAKAERTELGRWVNQPERMRFARVGEQIYGYYEAAFGALRTLCEGHPVLYSGVLCGTLYGGKLRPEHPLALFHDVSPDIVPATELPLENALDYLRKKDFSPELFSEGINRVTYQGQSLGWIKRIGARCNNMYPKESRIVNL